MATEERQWVLPGEPTPVRFMNTIWADRDGVHDHLATPSDVADWLAAVGFDPGAEVTAQEFHAARRLRDALRRAVAHATEDTRGAAASSVIDVAEAVAVINERRDDVPAERLTVHSGGFRRERDLARSPVMGGLAAVSAEAVDLLTAPDVPALGACMAPGCVLYFVKNHPRREWCSVACGNRARAARHYRRLRDLDTGSR
jgi:predicted RNA-binding Zn ribbon-like protein